MRYVFGCALLVLDAFEALVGAKAAQPTRFVGVTAGANHVCALTDHGEAHCWGSNEARQLGIGAEDAVPHTKPARVGGIARGRTSGRSHGTAR